MNAFKKDALYEKSFVFALRIVRLCRYLTDTKKEFVLSKQVLRAGTNPGAMVREAANAESGQDFIHKLSIAQKETAETMYWLDLLFHAGYLTEGEFHSLKKDNEELMRILRSSILTKKQNLAKKASSFGPAH